jgi:hypothetical protein
VRSADGEGVVAKVPDDVAADFGSRFHLQRRVNGNVRADLEPAVVQDNPRLLRQRAAAEKAT